MNATMFTQRRSGAFAAIGGLLLLCQVCQGFTLKNPTTRTVNVVSQDWNIFAASHPMSAASLPTTTALRGWFSGGGGTESKKDAVLGTFDISSSGDSQVQFESLSDYIRNKWALLFVNGSIKLTTPVKLDQIALSVSSEDDGVNVASGVRLLFQKMDTGYKSKEEEDRGESDNTENKKKKKKKDEPSQGGVEILVEQLEDGSLRVVAKRCDVEDDTLIKEMSEEKIMSELQKAIDVWKKDSA
jgi:hypothetical protein